ncbi:hypothetical protein CRENBAI_019417 [Crenichthys baileyi]|uniref:Uncharacterized protein n=1 Tax=Crenichthys baileyi TaxID=28760 RepID=A0AAV9SAL0_9TELE
MRRGESAGRKRAGCDRKQTDHIWNTAHREGAGLLLRRKTEEEGKERKSLSFCQEDVKLFLQTVLLILPHPIRFCLICDLIRCRHQNFVTG